MTPPELTLDPNIVCEVIELVTSVLLRAHAAPIAPPPDAGWCDGDDVWTGCVMITGAFSGAVSLACTRGFVFRAMHTMLGLDDDRSEDAARDVLAELTNVIGGNLKSLLSPPDQPCHVSIPVVSVGRFELPNAVLERSQWIDCDGDRFVVGLWQAPPDWAGRSMLRSQR